MRRLAFALVMVATPAAAIDPCLVGVWRADLPSLAEDMAAMMNSMLGGGVSARAIGGEVSMEINEGGYTVMLSDGMTIEMVPPGQPRMTITVNGYSEANMYADDGARYRTTVVDYSLSGSAEFLGQRMELPFDSATGLGGASRGGYSCAGDALSFAPDPQGSMPSRWTRIR